MRRFEPLKPKKKRKKTSLDVRALNKPELNSSLLAAAAHSFPNRVRVRALVSSDSPPAPLVNVRVLTQLGSCFHNRPRDIERRGQEEF